MQDLTMLLIEDDISFAIGVEMELENMGVQNVILAHTEQSAIEMIETIKPDIALVDIRLNGDSENLTVSKVLKSKNIPFILMTQYKEEKLYKDITRLAPLAYFSKPLDYVALKYTIDSYFQSYALGKKGEDLVGNLNRDFLFIKKGNKYLKVRFDDMIFVQAEGNYVTIQTQNAKFIIRGSLKKSLQLLPEKMFKQVHRNFVINFHYVDIYDSENSQLHLLDYVIPIGRSFKTIIRGLLKSNN